MTLDEFETLVLTQQPADQAWAPVTDYSEAGRQAAEGDHPRLIMETFAPTRVLDAGCGYNYLAGWLNDLAGHTIAYGGDLTNPRADFKLDITTPKALDVGADLVICREVLEHLTIRQIRQAVTNLCALSFRFVYLTTRFHPHPTTLLDVATSDDLDPTHISLLNQDLLRMLFVLEGFRRRADLEAQMDHQKKGRVLVYERVP
jgi:hypothetical protein